MDLGCVLQSLGRNCTSGLLSPPPAVDVRLGFRVQGLGFLGFRSTGKTETHPRLWMRQLPAKTQAHRRAHTHTHTHTPCVCVCVCLCVSECVSVSLPGSVSVSMSVSVSVSVCVSSRVSQPRSRIQDVICVLNETSARPHSRAWILALCVCVCVCLCVFVCVCVCKILLVHNDAVQWFSVSSCVSCE